MKVLSLIFNRLKLQRKTVEHKNTLWQPIGVSLQFSMQPLWKVVSFLFWAYIKTSSADYHFHWAQNIQWFFKDCQFHFCMLANYTGLICHSIPVRPSDALLFVENAIFCVGILFLLLFRFWLISNWVLVSVEIWQSDKSSLWTRGNIFCSNPMHCFDLFRTICLIWNNPVFEKM